MPQRRRDSLPETQDSEEATEHQYLDRKANNEEFAAELRELVQLEILRQLGDESESGLVNTPLRLPANQASLQAKEVLVWQEHAEKASADRRNPQQTPTGHVSNVSAQPVYDIEISWYVGSATAGKPDRIPLLEPEAEETRAREAPAKADNELSVIVTFRDAENARWLRKPSTGELIPWQVVDQVPTRGTTHKR